MQLLSTLYMISFDDFGVSLDVQTSFSLEFVCSIGLATLIAGYLVSLLST